MNQRTLQAVLRSLADGEPQATDPELLRKFVADRDADAFAALVGRYGRLVWAVCRHLTRSDADADDAFQATFVVLLRNAAKVRDAGKLSAWLHGVACKVCGKARQAAQRRATRERGSARDESGGSVVPDSAWDRALAAVHEEVATLPESLRVPFVLCCLEGKGVTEAAEQLGWKLGTFSGRLTRAKNALLARLEARGVSLGAAAAASVVSATAAPAAVSAKATDWLREEVTIPSSILQLTQGVVTMSASQGKLLAAALILACGLGVGGGSGWMASAEAQPPGQKRTAEEVAKSLNEFKALDKAPSPTDWTTAKWEYDFVLASDMVPTKFVQFLQNRESRGWEYTGQTTLLHDGKPAGHWVFRRPKAATVEGVLLPLELEPFSPPAGQKLRDAAARAQSTNNLKQIMLAVHNYEAANGHLPHDITDKNGKAILSWRVAILPYIEQDNLYKKMTLDEPWDSANNKQFSKMKVKTFLSPADFAAEGKDGYGLTSYKGAAGPDCIFEPGKNNRLIDITDGTSNTIAIVEAGDPIPWAKPGDYSFDPKKPLPKLDSLGKTGICLAGMGDGSVRAIDLKTVPERTLKAAFTKSGGEVLDKEW